MSWEIILVPEVHDWFLGLDDPSADPVRDAIKLAEERYDRYLTTPPEEIR